jgi:hypothetical protein
MQLLPLVAKGRKFRAEFQGNRFVAKRLPGMGRSSITDSAAKLQVAAEQV